MPSYNQPAYGTLDWHIPLNENWAALETDVENRDVAANRGSYTPDPGAKFYETDTGAVYIGDGTNWLNVFDPTSKADNPHGNEQHSSTFAVDGTAQPPTAHGNDAHTSTFAVDGDAQPPEAHGLGSAAHSAATLAAVNALISDATLDTSTASRPPQSHELGGAAHSATTLAALNALISNATLDDASATRPPQSHGNAAHTSTFAVEGSPQPPTAHGNEAHTATYAVDGDAQPPDAHALGGTAHTAATLAELNALVSDATLDTSTATRPPASHGNEAHSAAYIASGSTFNLGPASGDLGQIGGTANADQFFWLRNNATYGARVGYAASEGLVMDSLSYGMSFYTGGTTYGSGDLQMRITSADGVMIEGQHPTTSATDYEIQKNGVDGPGIINFKTG